MENTRLKIWLTFAGLILTAALSTISIIISSYKANTSSMDTLRNGVNRQMVPSVQKEFDRLEDEIADLRLALGERIAKCEGFMMLPNLRTPPEPPDLTKHGGISLDMGSTKVHLVSPAPKKERVVGIPESSAE